MAYYITLDKNDHEIKREKKGRGRPRKEFEQGCDGNYYFISIPKNEIVNFDKKHLVFFEITPFENDECIMQESRIRLLKNLGDVTFINISFERNFDHLRKRMKETFAKCGINFEYLPLEGATRKTIDKEIDQRKPKSWCFVSCFDNKFSENVVVSDKLSKRDVNKIKDILCK